MKNFIYVSALLSVITVQAQFNIHVEALNEFDASSAYLYTLSGSKDILVSKINANQKSYDYKMEKPYLGIMKLFFPENNSVISFISENKDINIKFSSTNEKIISIDYLDQSNKLMEKVQDIQKKKEIILPALYQIKDYYKPNSNFGSALDNEIKNLSQNIDVNPDNNPFVAFFKDNYSKFLIASANVNKPTKEEITNFLSNSDYLLESSSLMKPILLSYLNLVSGENVETSINGLLDKVNVETPRGQIILSELIEIFDSYSMDSLKQKFLDKAKSLKCTINDRLASTINANKNVELNAKFPNYKFISPVNTKAKSIYDVKADKKIIMFWASSCSHCEAELPVFIEKYSKLKEMGIDIIGLSLDVKKDDFLVKAASLPWINDSEFGGWYSTFVETYNISGTPTYFILDSSNKIIAKPEHAADVMEFLKIK